MKVLEPVMVYNVLVVIIVNIIVVGQLIEHGYLAIQLHINVFIQI